MCTCGLIDQVLLSWTRRIEEDCGKEQVTCRSEDHLTSTFAQHSSRSSMFVGSNLYFNSTVLRISSDSPRSFEEFSFVLQSPLHTESSYKFIIDCSSVLQTFSSRFLARLLPSSLVGVALYSCFSTYSSLCAFSRYMDCNI